MNFTFNLISLLPNTFQNMLNDRDVNCKLIIHESLNETLYPAFI